jgi:predicted phage baseplate assembly protein
LQPDGNVYRFGAVPPKGSTLRFDRYQYGGGVTGNVPANALTVIKTAIPYITRATNWEPALGGRDAETLEHAKLRAPHMLRTRTRAVTADDYEYLATQVTGVARAHCIAPGAQPATAGDPPPGQIAVVVLPQIEDRDDRIAPERLTLSAELRAAVLSDLNQRRVIGTALDVRAPQYQWVSILTTLQLADGSTPVQANRVIAQAEAELYRFLNPYRGGPRGEGWPFGRDLHVSEIYGLLLRVPNVESVEDVQIRVSESGSGANLRAVGPRLTVPRGAIICSDRHDVRIR